MCRAYEVLGYPNPYHFSSVFANAKDCDMWMEAIRAKFDGVGTFEREQWDQLLGHCGAVTDQPAILFAPELLEAYPDAKVVIVKRDFESWYRSIKALFASSLDPVFLAFRFTDPFWIGRITVRIWSGEDSDCCWAGEASETGLSRTLCCDSRSGAERPSTGVQAWFGLGAAVCISGKTSA